MELSKVQQEAVDFYTGCCNVIASAGSGKTRVLVNRIVKLIEDYDVEPGKILAITFSKKAKENMIERLTKMIPEYVNFINIETFQKVIVLDMVLIILIWDNGCQNTVRAWLLYDRKLKLF